MCWDSFKRGHLAFLLTSCVSTHFFPLCHSTIFTFSLSSSLDLHLFRSEVYPAASSVRACPCPSIYSKSARKITSDSSFCAELRPLPLAGAFPRPSDQVAACHLQVPLVLEEDPHTVLSGAEAQPVQLLKLRRHTMRRRGSEAATHNNIKKVVAYLLFGGGNVQATAQNISIQMQNTCCEVIVERPAVKHATESHTAKFSVMNDLKMLLKTASNHC